jgi:hypothetical protein
LCLSNFPLGRSPMSQQLHPRQVTLVSPASPYPDLCVSQNSPRPSLQCVSHISSDQSPCLSTSPQTMSCNPP